MLLIGQLLNAFSGKHNFVLKLKYSRKKVEKNVVEFVSGKYKVKN